MIPNPAFVYQTKFPGRTNVLDEPNARRTYESPAGTYGMFSDKGVASISLQV